MLIKLGILVATFFLYPLSCYGGEKEPFFQFSDREVFQVSSLDDSLSLEEGIIIRKFNFVGNTAFSNHQLAEAVKPFTQRKITFTELLEVEKIITNLYTENGYINSGAIINAGQKFNPRQAVITVEIIEGSVSEIKIEGLKRLRTDYVKNRLQIATATPFNVNRLYEALQVLQLNTLIANISAELVAGVVPQESILLVNVTESDSFSFMPIFNNGRSSSVGSFRRGVRIKEDNLFGFGDAIDFSYFNTDGSNTFNGSYSIPVNSYNGKIEFAGGFNDTRIIQEPFDVLNITGNSEYYEISFYQPVMEKPTQEFGLGVTFSKESSRSFLDGEPFPFSLGADIKGNTEVSAIRFFQNWTIRQPQDVFNLRSEFSLGIEAFGATINEELPDSRFLSWRSQLQYVRQLAPDSLFIFQTDLQLANDNLVTLEQFYLGGLYSVRGYPQDIRVTDNGLLLTTEAWFPILRVKDIWQNQDGVLQIIPFVDFGVGWNVGKIPNPSPNTLMGVGLGLQWQMGNNFNARIDYGIPLIHIERSKNSLNDEGIYFNINANF
ncbi:ShlB/FhaC/HecB family hemolysin secretion/activation protein [Cyanobacterium aponinum UTEX 3221]|uniref:ShlB/FhaC/HecB family hemolysin secretion/activation protein n=1 Tax=Cyanobacterium aponinum TaxID=379064 RepID=UPI002B4C0C9A|nr:ShlB/FhaC/HecB family hemolysin secretion/activation protein [Cyanobacterium aponinum]WRL38425.1 ShlB/FhaC/HecB family hemolysin secretion/activation protein [Cyanobacterium aponinum UTEX 3221]